MSKENNYSSKYALLRMIGISLGILSIGLAIAIIGYLLTTK